MEDSFKVRVDKVFGSLSSSSSSSNPSPFNNNNNSSLWSLTDEEIEKREWTRREISDDDEEDESKKEDGGGGFFLNQNNKRQQRRIDFFKEDSQLEDVDGGPSSRDRQVNPPKPHDYNDEEWEIKSCIGLDSTLDKEEEEDEFDKVAVGTENTEDRTYMTEVNDYVAYSDTYNELPSSFKDVVRDPRANHIAARLRLKEDTEAAGNMVSLIVSDSTSEDAVHLKSILKRKEKQGKPLKRVRFGSEITESCHEDKSGKVATETCPMEETPVSNEVSLLPQADLRVPDYIRNPSKYTCYTFEPSNEVDEESNREAYMDFFNSVRSSKNMDLRPDDGHVELPKSVAFTPKKKTGDATVGKNNVNQDAVGTDHLQRKGMSVSIAAGDVEQSEVCEMEEDEPDVVPDRGNGLRKSSRRYRTKPNLESEECVT